MISGAVGDGPGLYLRHHSWGIFMRRFFTLLCGAACLVLAETCLMGTLALAGGANYSLSDHGDAGLKATHGASGTPTISRIPQQGLYSTSPVSAVGQQEVQVPKGTSTHASTIGPRVTDEDHTAMSVNHKGTCAKADGSHGVWKAPAGTDATSCVTTGTPGQNPPAMQLHGKPNHLKPR